MNSTDFVAKAKDIAQNYSTLYVLGCFGAPLTGSNVARYCNNIAYNQAAARTAMIKAAANQDPPVYGFDCVGLIKGILWGWDGSEAASPTNMYGGAKYGSNGVPDTDANGMINRCPGASADFSAIVPGEAVWKPGHIGIYLGNGLAAECTPALANKVQITAVANIGKPAGYDARTWAKHGKLPWVDYTAQEPGPEAEQPDLALDVPSDWATEHWEWGKQFGITDGTDPRGPLTREQGVTMIHRLVLLTQIVSNQPPEGGIMEG